MEPLEENKQQEQTKRENVFGGDRTPGVQIQNLPDRPISQDV